MDDPVLEYELRKETAFITKLNNFVYNEGRGVSFPQIDAGCAE